MNKKRNLENTDKALHIGGVSGSAFSIEELHVLHSGLIAAKPRLNEKTKGYKETLTLINKLSLMISEHYR